MRFKVCSGCLLTHCVLPPSLPPSLPLPILLSHSMSHSHVHLLPSHVPDDAMQPIDGLTMIPPSQFSQHQVSNLNTKIICANPNKHREYEATTYNCMTMDGRAVKKTTHCMNASPHHCPVIIIINATTLRCINVALLPSTPSMSFITSPSNDTPR